MKKNLILAWLIIALLSIFCYVSPAQAASPIFTLTYPGQPGPLFTESNWAPLNSVTKQIGVTNNSDSTQKFALNLQNLLGAPNGQLAQVLVLEISRASNVLYTSHLSDLENKETFLENIPANLTYTYDIKVTMDDVGNEYQGSDTQFDLIWGFLAPEVTHGGGAPQEILGTATPPEELPQTGQDVSFSLITVLLMIIISAVISSGLHFKEEK